MRNLSVILFYLGLALIGIFLFLTIRWWVVSENPSYYTTNQERRLTPEEVEEKGYEFEFDKKYLEVKKTQVYISAGKYPEIHKRKDVKTDILIEDQEQEKK
ncbi:MAG: hypothetical protein ACNS62_10550 [Candidatus Cyclobacteriaceae bacterium M3_2C_046]